MRKSFNSIKFIYKRELINSGNRLIPISNSIRAIRYFNNV